MSDDLSSFWRHDLGNGDAVLEGRLPDELILKGEAFERLWQLHPAEHAAVKIFGVNKPIPRWQQAYGMDYEFAGQTSRAEEIPALLQPMLDWTCRTIDPRLNGILANWYDGSLGHYIGQHRDETEGLMAGSPIITVSLGEERTFRMRPWQSTGFKDLLVTDGSVVVIPFDTNLRWTHEVTHRAKYKKRRISITFRAFVGDE